LAKTHPLVQEKNMKYALKERIGDPALFCGRRQEMELLMNWVNVIPKEIAKSRALLGRRKCGKSAIMQRLFNILWNQNGLVIPFYFDRTITNGYCRLPKLITALLSANICRLKHGPF
jgi:hypothetical protein